MVDNFISKGKSRHVDAIKKTKSDTRLGTQEDNQSGLADLQKTTISLMNEKKHNWGFANSKFAVKRQKLANNLWKITIENPKTRKIVLEAEGHGDKVFAYEDCLARMAELLTEKDLKITTRTNA